MNNFPHINPSYCPAQLAAKDQSIGVGSPAAVMFAVILGALIMVAVWVGIQPEKPAAALPAGVVTSTYPTILSESPCNEKGIVFASAAFRNDGIFAFSHVGAVCSLVADHTWREVKINVVPSTEVPVVAH
jgi:hypothetical protein